MNGQRLKQLRISRGYSLEGLAAATDNIVSKQALSKYERDIMMPKPSVYIALAMALGVKPNFLLAQPNIRTEFIAYRKGYGLPEKEKQRVENLIEVALEKRVRLQELTDQDINVDLPIKHFTVNNIEEAEQSAKELRNRWNLGSDSIASMVDVLESRLIHVMDIEANDKFDGISAYSVDAEGTKKAACVVSRKGVPGERQRLNLAHELGHLCLNVRDDVDEEKAAFRFGSAFLAPSDLVFRVVGRYRKTLTIDELRFFRQQLGMSMQAILHRLVDLNVISNAEYIRQRNAIRTRGWEKQEPNESQPEVPMWFQKTIIRATVEGIISPYELAEIGVNEEEFTTASQKTRIQLLRKSKTERQKELRRYAKENIDATDSDFEDLETGDFYDE